MRLPALRHAGFRNYLFGSLVSNTGTSVQTWAIMWHIYHLTGSSYYVGLVGLVRVVPLLFFTLYGGVLADQTDRRKMMLISQTAMAVVALFASAFTWFGHAGIGFLYLVVAAHSVARAFDGPARQSMFVTLVPARDFPNAASINGIAWQMSDVLGPLIAGVIIATFGARVVLGLSLCYALNFVSFFAVLAAVWFLPPCRPLNSQDHAKTFAQVLDRIRDGLRFVAKTPVVRSAMWIDFWATLFSGATALIPAMAKNVLHAGALGYGVLASASGLGALIAALTLSLMPTIRRQGKTVITMIALYGLFTIFFGFANNLWVAAFCLAGVGASDMISTVLRQTIRQLATPDEMRGRMNATSSLFHISGPQLGDFEAGAVAKLWGERFSIVLGGALCLAVAAHWTRARALVQHEHSESDAETVIG